MDGPGQGHQLGSVGTVNVIIVIVIGVASNIKLTTSFFPTPPPMLSTMPSGKAGEGLQEYSPSLALAHTQSSSNALLPPQLYASVVCPVMKAFCQRMRKRAGD